MAASVVRRFVNLLSMAEALFFKTPSNTAQSITTSAADVAVTLDNPQSVTNADNTGRVIFYKLTADTAFVGEYFAAGETKEMSAQYIGGSGTGTAATKVIVRGVK